MRDYGKVHSSFWTSKTTRSMSEDGRALALYLLTCPHSTIAGVCRLPDGYVCDDMQWTSERVLEGFAELLRNGFANRCETTKWVWVIKHFEWNEPENPNQRKSALKIFNQIPNDCVWRDDFIDNCGKFIGYLQPCVSNRSETVSKPVTVTVTGAVAEAVEIKPPVCPQKPKRKGAKITFSEWIAQCRASGTKPITEWPPIWAYAEKVGLTNEMIDIAWHKFSARYGKDPNHSSKRYIDWRAVFMNSVEGNWAKLWYAKDGKFELSTVGAQADLSTLEPVA